jgi:hypothetical protein
MYACPQRLRMMPTIFLYSANIGFTDLPSDSLQRHSLPEFGLDASATARGYRARRALRLPAARSRQYIRAFPIRRLPASKFAPGEIVRGRAPAHPSLRSGPPSLRAGVQLGRRGQIVELNGLYRPGVQSHCGARAKENADSKPGVLVCIWCARREHRNPKAALGANWVPFLKNAAPSGRDD